MITGVEGNAFSYVPGWAAHSDYEVTLAGAKASGTLAVEADNRAMARSDIEVA